MATKKIRKVQTTDSVISPDLSPRDMDIKYTGGEPLFMEQPAEERRSGALVMSFNWYSRYYDRKMAKELLSSYAEQFIEGNDGITISKQLRKVDDKEILAPYGWLARLASRGLTLTDDEKVRIRGEIDRLVKTVNKPEIITEEKVEEKISNRPNVQEIMRDKAREACGSLEGLLDEFISVGAKSSDLNVNSVSVLSEKNVLPQHVSMLSEVWKKKLREFQEVASGKDPQLNEAYAHYGKNQLKAVIKFVEAVIAGFDSYINVKKAAKAPRKRKVVSPEKQVRSIKYLKTYEDATTKLSLTSLHPAKLVGASEAWLYDTAKRKIWYLVADSHVGALGVKGATILGFDASKSGVKTLRKPAEFLKKLMTAGKPAARKMFTEVNAVQAQPNGRTNEGLIILKVN
jgi:hypothetical protein